MHITPIIAAAACLAAGAAFAQSSDVRRSLSEVTGDVWRFDNNFHASMVVITDEGAVIGDPINADAAAWLEAEIMDRFGKEITYVLASHSHGDHSSGGEVLADLGGDVLVELLAQRRLCGRVDAEVHDSECGKEAGDPQQLSRQLDFDAEQG